MEFLLNTGRRCWRILKSHVSCGDIRRWEDACLVLFTCINIYSHKDGQHQYMHLYNIEDASIGSKRNVSHPRKNDRSGCLAQYKKHANPFAACVTRFKPCRGDWENWWCKDTLDLLPATRRDQRDDPHTPLQDRRTYAKCYLEKWAVIRTVNPPTKS